MENMKPPVAPTRLLYVGITSTSKELRLVITDNTARSLPYLALSYGRGGVIVFKLNQAN